MYWDHSGNGRNTACCTRRPLHHYRCDSSHNRAHTVRSGICSGRPGQSQESPQSSAPGTDVARDGGPAGIPSGSVGRPRQDCLRPPRRRQCTARCEPVPPRQQIAGDNLPLPAPGVVEMPTWWLFPGRWGVRAKNRASSHRDSGTRRVDAFERSRGYWNAYHLVRFLSDKARQRMALLGEG